MKKLLLSAFLAISLSLSPVSAQVKSDGSLPDPSLTPGDVRTTDAADVYVCAPKGQKRHSTKEIRKDLTPAVHEQSYKLYGFTSHTDKWCNTTQKCEVDHLISLVLGGTNSVKNLWPQPYVGLWNAHHKDKLENKLHTLVCDGSLSLTDAQTMIRTDWIAAYKKIFNTTVPLP